MAKYRLKIEGIDDVDPTPFDGKIEIYYNTETNAVEVNTPTAQAIVTEAEPDLSLGTEPSDGDVLTYNAAQGKWLNAVPSIPSLENIGDIDFETLSDGDVLVYNNTSGKWENAVLPIPDSSLFTSDITKGAYRRYTVFGTTIDNSTVVPLTTDGTNFIPVEDGKAYIFEIKGIGIMSDGSQYYSEAHSIIGTAKNVGGHLTVTVKTNTEVIDEVTGVTGLDVIADDGAIKRIKVTAVGSKSYTIKWAAYVELMEVIM